MPLLAHERARRALAAGQSITPASRPKWSSNACSWSDRSPTGAPWAARPSSNASGRGRRNRAARSSPNSSASALPATGAASGSRSTTGLSRAVAKVFVQLYRERLVYKDKRLVNWDPKFQTAISDLEVVQVETRGSFKWSRGDGAPLDANALAKALAKNPNGHLYYFDYPVVDDRRRRNRRARHRRHHPARNDARRHRGRGPS